MIDTSYIDGQLAKLNEMLPNLEGDDLNRCIKAIKRLTQTKRVRQEILRNVSGPHKREECILNGDDSYEGN